ncbi:MAG: 50S ribosomal protein L6 [Flavobacteriales bacterium]|nr:50S ribosomal protein L6 [Flavobacteriales bacterium]MCX7651186.1 50S ribosomal protein L6 [Flavobacteriales bacterium]MDW8432487.1 50S ribosomal protein L6 [Flavobacteriales bacterium]
MSRIGKLPVSLPKGVTFQVNENNVVSVKGPKGDLRRPFDPAISFRQEGDKILVLRATDSKRHKALHGLSRALLNNMVKGVSEGFKKEQELIGVGYRAEAKGQILELTLGYSHSIQFEIPSEVKVETKSEKGKAPQIILTSADNELLGMVAAKIRSFRKPEPYKGKGIKFVQEVLRRKAGKQAGKGK